MAIISGRNGKVNIGGLVGLPATNISVNSKAETVDSTNYTNKGYDSHVIGLYSAEITCDLLAVDSGYGIQIGSVGSVVILDDNSEGAVNPLTYTITNCILTAINYDAAVKDIQKMSLTFATYDKFSFVIGLNND
jgi:hypothetical protein